MPIFTWVPDQNVPKTVTTRTNEISFGDGYEQRVADGINSVKEAWDVTFSLRTQAEINAIDDFLVAQNGAAGFDWLTPRGLTKKFKCKSWTPVYMHAGNCSLSARFEQVFET